MATLEIGEKKARQDKIMALYEDAHVGNGLYDRDRYIAMEVQSLRHLWQDSLSDRFKPHLIELYVGWDIEKIVWLEKQPETFSQHHLSHHLFILNGAVLND